MNEVFSLQNAKVVTLLAFAQGILSVEAKVTPSHNPTHLKGAAGTAHRDVVIGHVCAKHKAQSDPVLRKLKIGAFLSFFFKKTEQRFLVYI